MSLVNLAVPALHNGVSQQTPVVRATDQGEEQINGWSSLANGLQKRSSTALVNVLLAGAAVPALIYHINRDATERYIVVASGGQLRVFDTNGLERIVHAPAGWGYLADTDPKALKFTTVADYTFVVNPTKTPAMVPVTDPEAPPETIPPPDYYLPPNRPGWGLQAFEP